MSKIQRIACIRLPSSRTGAPGVEIDPAALARLAGSLLMAAPRVTPVQDHPGAFWADASGMERRGTDAVVARALLAAAHEAGFPGARVGIGGTCITAAVATRERGLAWRVVPVGRDAAFLQRRSLALLPLSGELRESLALLGLRTCGELADLPAADVELRWGSEGEWARRLARADDPRWPFRPAPPDRATAEVEFEIPVESVEPLHFVLSGLVESVTTQMAARQRIPAALRLALPLEGGTEIVETLRPARPTAEPRVLLGLCRSALERIGSATAPIAGARLQGLEEGAARADQLDAFRMPSPDPAAVQAALLPVLARWGEDALRRAAHHGAHLPSAHALWEPTPLPDSAPARRGRRVRGNNLGVERGNPELALCLRRFHAPLPLRVRENAEQRPVEIGGAEPGKSADTNIGMELSRMHRVRSEGPERLSGGWTGEWEAREYWRVEFPSGWLGLVFRDARSGEWFLEGWFD